MFRTWSFEKCCEIKAKLPDLHKCQIETIKLYMRGSLSSLPYHFMIIAFIYNLLPQVKLDLLSSARYFIHETRYFIDEFPHNLDLKLRISIDLMKLGNSEKISELSRDIVLCLVFALEMNFRQ